MPLLITTMDRRSRETVKSDTAGRMRIVSKTSPCLAVMVSEFLFTNATAEAGTSCAKAMVGSARQASNVSGQLRISRAMKAELYSPDVMGVAEDGCLNNLTLPRPGRRDSPWLVVFEFAIITALFIADFRHHVYFSKTPFLFLLAWVSLRWRGLSWRDVGLARPANWRPTIVIGVLCGTGMELLELFVTQPLLVKYFHKMPDFSALGEIQGKWKILLLFLVGTWTLAAFGEEMVYRGYLMNRVAGLFQNPKVAWLISLIAVSFAFGLAHIDQGITGQLENMINGFLLGVIFLATGCNMWAAIITHGVTDTLDFLLLYFGKYPGM